MIESLLELMWGMLKNSISLLYDNSLASNGFYDFKYHLYPKDFISLDIKLQVHLYPIKLRFLRIKL